MRSSGGSQVRRRIDGGIGPLLRRPWPVSSQACARMPTLRLSTNRPRASGGGEAELGVDDRGAAVDVDRHRPAAARAPGAASTAPAGAQVVARRRRRRRRRRRPAPAADRGAGRRGGSGARIRAGTSSAARHSRDDRGGRVERGRPSACRDDLVEQLDALLAGAAVESPSTLTPVATALLRPTPQVAAIRATAIDGACGPWSTAATSAASSSAPAPAVGRSPRSISQIIADEAGGRR